MTTKQTPYFMPPSGYKPPRKCTTCDEMISFTPVMGGHLWTHLVGSSNHRVTIRKTGYFDTMTGETVIGNPLRTNND